MAAITSRPRSASPPPFKDSEKAEISEIEAVPVHVEQLTWAERQVADEDRPPGFWGKFLKKNPSPEFLADVQKMNKTVLDPRDIKRLERKIDFLIMPVLAVCYMVCISLSLYVLDVSLTSQTQFYYV